MDALLHELDLVERHLYSEPCEDNERLSMALKLAAQAVRLARLALADRNANAEA